MTKGEKLKICNWSLAILLMLILGSSIQLEMSGGETFVFVIVHIVVALLFMTMIINHIYFHFNWNGWLKKFSKQKVPTRILWWLYLLTFLSGFVALVHWAVTATHSPVGGVHGKIGFLMLLFAAGHFIKRFRFYKIKRRRG